MEIEATKVIDLIGSFKVELDYVDVTKEATYANEETGTVKVYEVSALDEFETKLKTKHGHVEIVCDPQTRDKLHKAMQANGT